MARKLRIHRPGAFYHIMLRGNNSQSIFASDSDRCRMSLLIQQGVEKFKHRIHGFCMMDNHIHLVLQAGDQHLSRAMHHLAFRYTQYFNKKENRVGHLFQGRFKAILIDDHAYLLELIRYVHLNPVRANLCLQPDDYPWSGHQAYLGSHTFIWLTKDTILKEFHTHEAHAQAYYKAFIQRGIHDSSSDVHFEQDSHKGRSLGQDEFTERILQENHYITKDDKPYSLEKLIEVVCLVLEESPSVVCTSGQGRVASKARALVAFFVRNATHITLKSFADLCEKDLSSLSRLASELEQKSFTDPKIANEIESVQTLLQKLKSARAKA